MKNGKKLSSLRALIHFVAIALLVLASRANAEDWQYMGEVYALAADVSATSAQGKAVGADFDDILDNLEFAFFGKFAANRDKLTLMANVLYVDVEASQRNGTASAELALENIVSTAGAGWLVFDNNTTTLNVLGGVRYLSMDVDLQLNPDSINIGDRVRNWGAVLGFQGKAQLAERWYLTYYADVGAGDSDLTWQAIAGINYQFTSLDVVLGYQHVAWEFDGDLLEDLEMAGPAIGMKFHF